MATDVSVKGHVKSTAMYVSSWHSTASEGLYSLCKCQTRHGTARHGTVGHDHSVRTVAVHLQRISFLKNSFFHIQKWFQFTDFCFWTQLFYNYVSRACNSVTLPCVLSNERVSLSYGGVINILYNLDLPDTKFLGKYLLNLHRAICSTTQNRLGSMFQCSQVQHKVSFISCSN